MVEFQTWRDLLGQIIQDPYEKERIASEVGINAATLVRWANGESKPRSHNFQELLKALPEHRKALAEAMKRETGQSFESLIVEDGPQEIPSAFYTRVLHTLADTSQVLRFRAICDLIFQQALKHLDPNRVGMEITLVRCMFCQSENKVRSLREVLGRGTPPFPTDLEFKTLFLGTQSFAGYIVSTGRLLAIETREERQNLFPAVWLPGEQSAAGCPIRRGNHVAGCLLFSCTQPHYFVPSRLTLIQNYAEAIALAFEADEFYDQKQIDLRLMPSPEEQKPLVATFRERVNDVIRKSARAGHALPLMEAEQFVWQQLEEEFLAAV